jgi:hypothetical protein
VAVVVVRRALQEGQVVLEEVEVEMVALLPAVLGLLVKATMVEGLAVQPTHLAVAAAVLVL